LKEVEKMNLTHLEFVKKYSFENKEHGVKELIAILHNIMTSILEKRSVIFEKKKNK
jgi:predicted component of type VI protein secretion system